jgi:hypothetical protein
LSQRGRVRALPPPPAARALPLLAPAVLCALALSQMVLAGTIHLSPWKGGGFGMFSTNDHGGFRSLRALAEVDGTEQRLRVPDALRRDALRAREVPTDARLGRLARALLAGAEGAHVVRVEVWRLEFDADLTPSRRLLAEARATGP